MSTLSFAEIVQSPPEKTWQAISNELAIDCLKKVTDVNTRAETLRGLNLHNPQLPSVPLSLQGESQLAEAYRFCEASLRKIEPQSYGLDELSTLNLGIDRDVLIEAFEGKAKRLEMRLANGVLNVTELALSIAVALRQPNTDVRAKLLWLHEFVRGNGSTEPVLEQLKKALEQRIVAKKLRFESLEEWSTLRHFKGFGLSMVKAGFSAIKPPQNPQSNNASPDDSTSSSAPPLEEEQWLPDAREYSSQLDKIIELILEHDLEFQAATSQRPSLQEYELKLRENGIEWSAAELRKQGEIAIGEAHALLLKASQKVALKYSLPNESFDEVKKKLLSDTPGNGTDLLAAAASANQKLERIINEQQLLDLPSEPLQIKECSTTGKHKDLTYCGLNFPQLSAPDYLAALSYSDGKTEPTVLYPDYDFLRRSAPSFTARSSFFWMMSHEGRPGHDLQLRWIQKHGSTLARAYFSMRPANFEGWALYAEHLMRPFVVENDVDSEFFFAAGHAWRVARAIADVALNLGDMTNEQAVSFLVSKGGLDKELAIEEVKTRYIPTPGRDGAYFYGFFQVKKLHDALKYELGTRFSEKAFHNALIENSFLPFSKMHKLFLRILPSKRGLSSNSTKMKKRLKKRSRPRLSFG